MHVCKAVSTEPEAREPLQSISNYYVLTKFHNFRKQSSLYIHKQIFHKAEYIFSHSILHA